MSVRMFEGWVVTNIKVGYLAAFSKMCNHLKAVVRGVGKGSRCRPIIYKIYILYIPNIVSNFVYILICKFNKICPVEKNIKCRFRISS